MKTTFVDDHFINALYKARRDGHKDYAITMEQFQQFINEMHAKMEYSGQAGKPRILSVKVHTPLGAIDVVPFP